MQALRVTIIVLTVPPLVVFFGSGSGIDVDDGAASLNGTFLAAALGAAGLAALAFRRWLRMPNPWLFGPMTVGAALALGNGHALAMPPIALVVAQVSLGLVLGSRFERTMLAQMPRVAAAGTLVALVLILAAYAGARGISAVSTIPFETAFLAVAPAGIAEMVLTAKLLHLDGVTVTAFHLMRIVVVTSGIYALFGLYEMIVRRISQTPPPPC
jgi:uncharacterized protein